MKQDDEAEFVTSKAREARRRRDLDDWNNETAGRDVGRIRRFVPDDARPDTDGKHRQKEQAYRSALMAILQDDPEYAALHAEAMDRLRRAEAATDIALTEAENALSAAKDELADLKGKASALPDGTKVFRDADGNVWTEDGRKITGPELDQIEWRDGAPSYEAFLAKTKALADAQAAYDELLRYQVEVLGAARDRLTDEDNPPTKEELGEIKKALEEQMPPTIHSVLQPSAGSETPSLAKADHAFSVPKL